MVSKVRIRLGYDTLSLSDYSSGNWLYTWTTTLSTNKLVAGTWTHVAYAWDTDTSEMHLYVDGMLVARHCGAQPMGH